MRMIRIINFLLIIMVVMNCNVISAQSLFRQFFPIFSKRLNARIQDVREKRSSHKIGIASADYIRDSIRNSMKQIEVDAYDKIDKMLWDKKWDEIPLFISRFNFANKGVGLVITKVIGSYGNGISRSISTLDVVVEYLQTIEYFEQRENEFDTLNMILCNNYEIPLIYKDLMGVMLHDYKRILNSMIGSGAIREYKRECLSSRMVVYIDSTRAATIKRYNDMVFLYNNNKPIWGLDEKREEEEELRILKEQKIAYELREKEKLQEQKIAYEQRRIKREEDRLEKIRSRDALQYVLNDGEYKALQITCNILKSIEKKNNCEASINREKKYSNKYGVVNLTKLNNMKQSIMNCDATIALESKRYRELTGRSFNSSNWQRKVKTCDKELVDLRKILEEGYLKSLNSY